MLATGNLPTTPLPISVAAVTAGSHEDSAQVNHDDDGDRDSSAKKAADIDEDSDRDVSAKNAGGIESSRISVFDKLGCLMACGYTTY